MSDAIIIFANRRSNRRWLERVLTDDGALTPTTDADTARAAVADLADGLETVLTRMADHPDVPFVVCHEDDHDDRCRLSLRAGASECIRLDAAGDRLRAAVHRAARIGTKETMLLVPRIELMERIFATTSDRSLDPAAQIDEVLRLGCELFSEEIGIVARISGNDYTVAHVHDPSGGIRVGSRFDVRKTFCSIALEAGRPLGIADVHNSLWQAHPCTDTGLESYIGVPIVVDERPFGTLSFSSPMPHFSPFRDRDLDFVGALGEWIGTLTTRELRLRELKTLVTHDRLTGLPNRDAILKRLERSVRRAERTRDYGFALLFIDLDGFKAVNDQLGHLAGDTLLRQVAGEIRTVVRPKDGVGHFAGDEFVVLLEDADLAQARTVADRIVEALSRPLTVDGRWVHIGASVGVAMGTSSDSARELVIAADEAMYTAKSTGQPVVSVPAGS